METRANFVLIGAFTLFGILGSLGFFLWLAKVEVDRQYAYYDILFTDVSGLGDAGDVRYNGLPVGQVVRLSLDSVDPGKVRVRVEIDAATPVKTDTVATLELQGVTGVSYVSLSGGSPETERLQAAPGEKIPVIASRRSAVQSLFEGGPELLTKAIVLLEDIDTMVNAENRAAVASILGNLESASGELDSTLRDFSALSAELSKASARITAFTDHLDEVADSATATLDTAGETLKTARSAIEKAGPLIDEATGALASAQQTFDSANGVMTDQLPGLIDQVEATAGAIETVVTDVGGKAGEVVGKIDRLSDVAIARLTDAEATFAKLDAALDSATSTMASIEETSRSVDTLVKGDGAALVADARRAVGSANQALSAANRVILEDLPLIVADIRGATGTVNTVISRVGEDLSGVSGKLDAIAANANTAILSATETFRNANETLAAVTATMTTAEGTLDTARETFTGVNRLLDEDVEAIIADIRGGVASLNTVLGQVSGDLPEITAELRRTLANAAKFVDSMDGIVGDNADQIEIFMQAGLPQFVRFMQEGSRLIANLQRLTAKIERDPARFLLGTQSPEFRR
jgi:phospholipid/cholesterol/gamma-HCH transport system substrate-binding protein